MELLARLAAWYLRGRVKGFVLSTPANAIVVIPNERSGWIYGKTWHINF